MLKGWGATATPTASEAVTIVRSFGVPCVSDADIVFVSDPAPFRGGRRRLLILTSRHVVYCRALDTLQTVYHAFGDKAWDLDWTAPVDHVAHVGDDDEHVRDRGALSISSAFDDPFGRERDTALLTVHIRHRDAWLGDPDATRRRAVALKREQLDAARDRLRDAMRASGRVPAISWAERPSKTTLIVYLRRAADDHAVLVSMLERICRDHGLVPTTRLSTSSSDAAAVTHHRLRATTPPGSPTAMDITARVGRHPVKGEMLVLEYRRMEAEEAAMRGLQVAGTIVAVAALTGLVVAAGGALAGIRTGGGGGGSNREDDAGETNRNRRATRRARGASPTVHYHYVGFGSEPVAAAVEGVANSLRGRSGARSIASVGVARGMSRAGVVVRADDPCLGTGVAARDAFFERFAANVRRALSNAEFVASPASPALFALVRESPGTGTGTGTGIGDGGDGDGDGDGDDGWTLVLTPESRWANAADEPSAPPGDAGTETESTLEATERTRVEVPERQDRERHDDAKRRLRDRDAESGPSLVDEGAKPTGTGTWTGTSRSGILRMDVDSDGVPKNFLCPITQTLFEDPVIWVDGHTYERTAIARWLRTRDTSPMTGERFGGAREVLLPNHAMRSQVEEWREQNPTVGGLGPSYAGFG